MSLNNEILLSELKKLRLESSGKSSTLEKNPFSNYVSNSEFEEFKNEQNAINKEVIEVLRMMRKEMSEMKEKQEKNNEKVLEELKTIRNNFGDLKQKMKSLKIASEKPEDENFVVNEFRKQQYKFNKAMIEDNQKMREEFPFGMYGIAVENTEKQDNIEKEMIENLETVKNEMAEMKEKQEIVHRQVCSELENLKEKIPMKINIKINENQTITVKVARDDYVLELKQKITDQIIFFHRDDYLELNGAKLEDNYELQHYGIMAGSTIKMRHFSE